MVDSGYRNMYLHIWNLIFPSDDVIDCVIIGRCSALTFRYFVPRSELLTLFKDFWKNMKINYFSLFCKSYLVLFLTFIMVLRFYAAPPHIQGFFGTVLKIFIVAFVRAVARWWREKVAHQFWWWCHYYVMRYTLSKLTDNAHLKTFISLYLNLIRQPPVTWQCCTARVQ